MNADSTTTMNRRTNAAAAATPATIQADVPWVDALNEEYNVKKRAEIQYMPLRPINTNRVYFYLDLLDVQQLHLHAVKTIVTI